MKKAVSAWAFASSDVRECIDKAKLAGFDGIELAMDENGEINAGTDQGGLKAIRSYAEGKGVSVHSLAHSQCWKYSLAADDEGERRAAIEAVTAQIRAAEVLGASSVLVIPGGVSSVFRPGVAPVRYDVAYERNLDAFGVLKHISEECGVFVGVENVWNGIFMSPLEMRDFVDKVGSPFVGAYFDVGNVLAFGRPEHWIDILGKRIKKVHFKDFRLNSPGLEGFVDLLSGDVDWPAVAAALRRTGYDGWCTAEMPPYRFFPEQVLYSASAAMDKIFTL